MTRIRVGTGVPYDVTVGDGVSAEAPAFVREALGCSRKVAIVTDANVEALHGDAVAGSLADAGLDVARFAFPAGERSKTLATYAELMAFLAAHRMDRSGVVVALGGGVAGDLAGFAAATYMRGMDFVQIPTSLLAMVDSSVGGKTGVDLAAGKNLVGAFHQPRAVFCDTRFLATLPDGWRMDGMGEVLKYAVLGDRPLFERLEANPCGKIGEGEIADCIRMKCGIVEKDEREGGVRKLLNLGHTFAHAIERLSGYSVSHGRAVATGIAMVSRYAARSGILAQSDSDRIASLVTAMGYATHTGHSPADIAEAALGDKKVSGEHIDLVVPQSIGRCVIRRIPLSDMRKVAEDAV